MSQGLPYVRLKQAMSVDGRTAMASGESQWITGPQARAAVQRLRARSCAVVTGVDSVLQDDSRLTVREDQLGLEDAKLAALVVKQQPLRVILDSWLRLPATASILQQPGETLVMTLSVDPSATAELQAAGATVVEMPASNGHVDLSAVLKWLAEQRQVNEVLVETGSVLAGAFIESDLVDELQIFMAPVLMGSEARPLVALPIAAMAEKRALQIDDIRAVGLDWLITARPK
jgi:diaminohydroxyphosphoribosylaminopyrimidine deaminase/5-amino-6-(5-phosphoribosylamino)uracil reductase